MIGSSENEWDADFIVIGSGGAGLTGALTAAIKGLRVIVLEKTSLIGGTTAVSGGTSWIPNNHLEAGVGVADSREEALAYLNACIIGVGDPTHIDVLVDHGPEVIKFLEEEGGMEFLATRPGGSSMDYRSWLPGAKVGGRALVVGKTATAPFGEFASKLRITHTSAWTFDPRDYNSEAMHLDAPGAQRPGASVFAPPTGEEDAIPANLARGAALVAQLVRGGLAHGVDYRVDVRAEEIIEENGRAVGVRVSGPDGEAQVLRASAGVLVATGGFSHDEELKRLWLSRRIQYSCELESNSGDGHRMGMAIGAQTAGIGDAWWMPHLPLGSDNSIVNTAGSREDRALPHVMIVNDKAKRFMNESINYHDVGKYFDSVVGGWEQNFPAWLVFDGYAARRYAVLAWKVPAEGAPTPDWLRIGASLADLAREMEVDPTVFEATVERFNGFAQAGVDEDFQRGETAYDRAWGDPANLPNPCLGALSEGPFYAVRMYAGALSTRGGLRVDDKGRVYSAASQQPIPGLYAAGNCSNGGPTSCYPGPGATLGAALTFGYVAAMDAADSLAPVEGS
ncbi:FAD-binding protein [Leifsonia kafniensis]|uniref:FAD-binding protein n=1 Tax=Leifsonia kafniensis TaxID=475957 RepID=UPI0031E94282